MTRTEEQNIIVGLDIGTHKVVAVVGEMLPDGVINVIGTGSVASKGIANGGVIDVNEAVQSVTRAIEQAESVADCEINRVTLAISGAHITAVNESGTVPIANEVTSKDLDSANHLASSVRLADGLDILHVIPQEYKVDHLPNTKNPVGLRGVRLKANAHLIACHQDWRSNLVNVVERCKLKVDDVVFSGLASSYSVLTEAEKELGVCLVDIGSGTMDILVYTDGALRFSKVIPFAGGAITNYIAQQFSTSVVDAEAIKVQYSSAVSPPKLNPEKKIEFPGLGGRTPRIFTKSTLASVTASCYNDLLKIIYGELVNLNAELVQQGIKQDLIAGIVLTGGGAQIEDLAECARNVFQAQVRIASPLNITGLTDSVNKPQYATVLGLLQYSYFNGIDKTMLIPQSGRTVFELVKKFIKTIKDNF